MNENKNNTLFLELSDMFESDWDVVSFCNALYFADMIYQIL